VRDRSLPGKYSRQKLAWVAQYKAERGCSDCGEMDPVVLELDHLDPSTKDAKLRRGSKWGRHQTMSALGWKRLFTEVEKCEVVCANCHRRRTAKRREQNGTEVNQLEDAQERFEF
jgi:hypothetical protein